MSMEFTRPSEIERASLNIIRQELSQFGILIPEEDRAVVERVIHATADFDYARNLIFTDGASSAGVDALSNGTPIVTDTNMAAAGVSKQALARLGSSLSCYMADPEIAQKAKEEGTTRAVASIRYAAAQVPEAVFAVGNAPTALLELEKQIHCGLRPAMIIAVPVGFVNVVEAKERILACCREFHIPCIAALGQKGGSTVAAAICNALVYSAAEMLDPAERGWN